MKCTMQWRSQRSAGYCKKISFPVKKECYTLQTDPCLLFENKIIYCPMNLISVHDILVDNCKDFRIIAKLKMEQNTSSSSSGCMTILNMSDFIRNDMLIFLWIDLYCVCFFGCGGGGETRSSPEERWTVQFASSHTQKHWSLFFVAAVF